MHLLLERRATLHDFGRLRTLASFPRRLAAVRGTFGSYLAQLQKPQALSNDASHCLWPMPLPFVGRRLCPPRRRRRRVLHWQCRAFEAVLNLLVAALNFLAGGSRARMQPELRRRRPFSETQCYMLDNLAELALQWCGRDLPASEVHCGRKASSIAAYLAELEREGVKLAGELDPYSSKIARGPRVHDTGGSYVPLVAEKTPFPTSESVGAMILEPFLNPGLLMGFLNPLSLRSLPPRTGRWPHARRRSMGPEDLALAAKWDAAHRLAVIEDVGQGPLEGSDTFGVPKSAEELRQILDRRGPNGSEDLVGGASRATQELPSAAQLVDIVLDDSAALVTDSDDLSHCYHQVVVSEERAATNILGYSLPWRLVMDFSAAVRVKERLLAEGLTDEEISRKKFFLAFGGLAMGHHWAVEWVQASHRLLLADAGLLGRSEVRGRNTLPESSELHLVVVDDLKIIRRVPLDVVQAAERGDAGARRVLEAAPAAQAACAAYQRHGWRRSETKARRGDVRAEVLGAELDGEQGRVGASLGRRHALQVLTISVLELGFATAHLLTVLLGLYTQCFLFRRPLLAIFEETYIDARTHDHEVMVLRSVVRAELSLALILIMSAETDLRVPFPETIWSLDASPWRGAFVGCPAAPAQVRALWREGERKGGYTKLANSCRALLTELGYQDEELDIARVSLSRPPAFRYDFLEVYAGSAKLSEQAAAAGLHVGPPIDLKSSRRWDVTQCRCLEFLFWLLAERRVLVLWVATPCFSDVDAKVLPRCSVGLRLLELTLVLLMAAWRAGVAAVDESVLPRSGSRRACWRRSLTRMPFGAVSFPSSCSFGDSCRVDFALLYVGIELSDLDVSCKGFHSHTGAVRSRGSGRLRVGDLLGLASAVVKCVVEHVAAVAAEEKDEAFALGFERVHVDELSDTLPWRTERTWTWRRPAHINLLEQKVVASCVKERIRRRQAGRVSFLVDSRVTMLSGIKGRSSSRALNSQWKLSVPLILGGALYPSYHFVPSRKNRADGPSRDRPPSPPCRAPPAWWTSLASGSSSRAFARWAAVPPLNARLAQWAIFVLLLVDVPSPVEAVFSGKAVRGPSRRSFLMLLWSLVLVMQATLILAVRRLRGERPPLPEGRAAVLTAATVGRRATLLAEFGGYLAPQRIEALLERPRELAHALVAFGRKLYGENRSMRDYAETINAIVDQDRSLRRSMTPAWDLVGMWRAVEPPEHRLAMPPVAAAAFISLALAWGWVKTAALIALGWTAFLRPGEFLAAKRRQLCLPRDLLRDERQAWLRISSPKSRFRGAREQLARCDEGWVVDLLDAIYGSLPPAAALWPASPSAFRRRWDTLGAALAVATSTGGGLTPASLRGGGATQFYAMTEDLVRLQHRARWQCLGTLQIYVQEVSPVEYLIGLQKHAQDLLRYVAALLPRHVSKALWCLERGVPSCHWFLFFKNSVRSGPK